MVRSIEISGVTKESTINWDYIILIPQKWQRGFIYWFYRTKPENLWQAIN
jgi:hypothetical protein